MSTHIKTAYQPLPKGAFSAQLHLLPIPADVNTVFPVLGIGESGEKTLVQSVIGFNIQIDGNRIISGLQNPNGSQILWIANYTDYTLTIVHDSATNAIDGFRLPANQNFTLLQNQIISIVYDDELERWILCS